MPGGGRKRGRTQRRHFKQNRENVWNHVPKKARPDQPPSSDAAATATDTAEADPLWQPFTTRNPNFEEYYKEQNIVAKDEWEEFISVLQKPLPAAFRINSSGQFFQDILSQLENDFVDSLKAEVNDDLEVEAIRPLPWYPGKLAWHLNFSRMQLRKNQTLESFHEFLKLENEVGNITRQEAVSMVPPLFLKVHPNHYILDMCAAPGSKTFQLLEIIHQSVKPGFLPTGLVIANDVDVQRCNLLIHQTKRMCTANLIVTNHEAQHFPSYFFVKDQPASFKTEEELTKSSLQFDRVLCDVPCSGDGTLRKAPDIWRKWNAGMGNGLHRLQLEIAMRGISLLKVGGRMVYSTCSMNPVENEAVVAEVLRRSGGSVTLLNVSNEFPELIRRPGLKTWKIKDRGLWFVSYKNVPNYRSNVILPSMFPSGESYENSYIHHASQKTEENVASSVMSHSDDKSMESESISHTCCDMDNNNMTDNSKGECELQKASINNSCIGNIDCDSGKEFSSFPLERCMRIVPHDQNGGAFFIAVFEKTSPLQVMSDATKQSTQIRLQISENVDEKIQELQADVPSSDDVVNCNKHNAAETPTMVDIRVHQATNLSRDNDVCNTNKNSEGAEACANDIESSNIDTKNLIGKLQMQGKWKGVDPVVFFEEESIIASIRSFYGIAESFPLAGHLVTRNTDVNHVKRIYYISKSVQDILHFNIPSGQRLKIASLGLKVFERQSSKDNSSSCNFRLSSEGLPLLLPYISKQILYASLVDFQHLLQYRLIKFPDFVNADFREKASSLESGCCVVILNKESEAKYNHSLNGLIAIVCWKGKTNLSIMLSALDGKELLDRVSARFGKEENLLSEETNDAELESERKVEP